MIDGRHLSVLSCSVGPSIEPMILPRDQQVSPRWVTLLLSYL